MYFADTVDRLGLAGAKSMSENPFKAIAAALGNAIRDATGVRFVRTPSKADRIYRQIIDHAAVTKANDSKSAQDSL